MKNKIRLLIARGVDRFFVFQRIGGMQFSRRCRQSGSDRQHASRFPNGAHTHADGRF